MYRKHRGVAERSNAAVLKTVEPQGSGGSNPSSSASSAIALATADTKSIKQNQYLEFVKDSRFFDFLKSPF